MPESAVEKGGIAPSAPQQDMLLGAIVISPETRAISGYGGRALLEPRMMQVLTCLAERPNRLVTRAELIARCWHGRPIGDDSLNRAIAGIRRAVRQSIGEALQIETIAGAGYTLKVLSGGDFNADAVANSLVRDAVAEGWRSWRLGLPEPDRAALERLRRAVLAEPRHPEARAILALLLRHAAEHAEANELGHYVEECRGTADAALALDPNNNVARSALVSLPPLFGDWLKRRSQLTALLVDRPDCGPALHDLAILEMATGRPSAAVPLIEELLEREPLAAIFHYKRVYHLWTLERLSEMDRVADRAMQLWPRHPAIWFARFWTLAFTGRPDQAMEQLTDDAMRPAIPPAALAPLERTLAAVKEPHSEQARKAAIKANLQAGERGPAQSVAAIIHLGGLGAVDEAFEVAEAYLTRHGLRSVSLRKTATDPSVTDQHRRVTQMLFIPSAQALRASARFDRLCEDIGLAAYWQQTELMPDYRRW